MKRQIMVINSVNSIMKDWKDKSKILSGANILHNNSLLCNLLARKRNLDVEICAVAGFLQNYFNLRIGDEVSNATCASEAEKLLRTLGCFSKDEMQLIYRMILNSTKFDEIGDSYEEVLKDAGILLKHLYSVEDNYFTSKYSKRLDAILKELNMLS